MTVKPADRLSLTIFLAAILHALIILGITFEPPKPSDNKVLPTLDIILVNSDDERTNEDADYLAQSNQRGGGQSETRDRPREMFAADLPNPTAGVSPSPQQASQQNLKQTPSRILHGASDPAMHDSSDPQPVQPLPDAATLLQNSLAMARLTMEVSEYQSASAKKNRETTITANTRSIIGANYMNSWVDKVERVGNMNFPSELVRSGAKQNLLMDVALKPDGTIDKISVIRSSGSKSLDDAAKRIVRLSAPFAPFPEELKKEADIVHIVREWQFINENSLPAH